MTENTVENTSTEINKSNDEKAETFNTFALFEDERKSVTLIVHNCSMCGNTFDHPVIITVVNNGTTGPTENDIPGVVCGNH